MRIKVTRKTIEIIPECEQDDAFLEEVLDLRKNGDAAKCELKQTHTFDGYKCVEISNGGNDGK